MRMFWLAIVAIGLITPAGAATCTRQDAMAAERSSDRLDNWPAFYHAYRRYRQCDDGGLAERYSDAVAKQMAYRWTTIGEAAVLARRDPEFGAWLLRHLDETVDNADLVAIEHQARRNCPRDAGTLCRRIRQAIQSLGCDARFPQGAGCIAARP